MVKRFAKAAPDEVSPSALVASAARLDLSKKPKTSIQQDWQAEAWEFYDDFGELRYAAHWMGNSLSRAAIYAADVGDDGKPSGLPTTNAIALGAAHDLLGGPTSQAGILNQVGVHLTIAGDCYIIGETPVDALGNELPDDEWYVASTDELSYSQGAGWQVDRGNGKRTLDPQRTVIIRVWQSHPKKKWQADSPTRAVLPVLRELKQLVRTAGQQMDSTLAGAGLLLLPSEVKFPAPSAEALEQNPGVDPLMLSLAESILTPYEDPTDSARLVPLALRVPGDYVDKVRLISFANALQAENQAAREACIRRLALGLDMPPEQLLGMGGINHWGVWGVEEAGVKLHIVPRLLTIVSALNEGYYEPALERLGLAPYKFTLWFDVSQLTQRPNRSADAQAIHGKGELSGEALRSAAGFAEGDAPSIEERTANLLHAVITANPSGAGDLVPALVHLWSGGKVSELNLTAPAPAPDDSADGDVVDGEEADPPADPDARALPAAPSDTPTPTTPAQEAVLAAADEVRSTAPELASREIVAAHLLTQRALELAGKRLLTRERRAALGSIDARIRHLQVPVTPADLDRLLAGAFDWVEELAVMVQLDPTRLRDQLTEYVGGLLTSGTQHDVRYLAAVVRKARRGAAA